MLLVYLIKQGVPNKVASECIYIYITGVARYTDVTVRYVPRFGVTVRCDFGTTGEKNKSTMLGFFSFILTKICTQIKAGLYPVIINKTTSV